MTTRAATPHTTLGRSQGGPRRLLIVLLTVVMAACVGALAFSWSAIFTPMRVEREAVAALSAAATPEARAEAVGKLGLVIDRPGSEWIAIHYHDSHGDPFYSVAVARTSDGRWLRSRQHYCALFSAYRSQKQLLAMRTSIGDNPAHPESWFAEEQQKLLHNAEMATTMDEAVRRLEELGFTPFTP